MTRIAVCLALAAAVVGVASAATVEPRRGHALQMQSHRLGGCSGATAPRVARSVRLPGKPGPLLVRRRTLWVGIQGSRPGRPGRLLALDAASGRLRKAFRLPFDPLRLAAGFGSLWITGEGVDRRYRGVIRLDPRSGRVLSVIHGAKQLGTALATTRSAVWVGGPDVYPKGHPEKAGVYFASTRTRSHASATPGRRRTRPPLRSRASSTASRLRPTARGSRRSRRTS
jgi:hypothetical protein